MAVDFFAFSVGFLHIGSGRKRGVKSSRSMTRFSLFFSVFFVVGIKFHKVDDEFLFIFLLYIFLFLVDTGR